MKIVFFVHCFFPDHFYGTETYTLGLARHYHFLNHDVVVVTAVFLGEAKQAKQTKLIQRYSWERIQVIAIDKNIIPHSRIKETYYLPEMRGVYKSILKELKPDIVHITHLINHTSILLEVLGELNIPTYATFTDFFGFCFNNRLESANGNLCFSPSASRDNCIACYLTEALLNTYTSSQFSKTILSITIMTIAKGLVSAQKLGLLKNSYFKDIVEDLVQRPNILSHLYNTYYKGAIAPTNFLKRVYEKNGISIPITKLLFGVDINRCPKPLRNSNHIPVIGYIGLIAYHKGTDLIVKSFKRLPKKSAILNIYGSIDESTNYTKKIKALSEGVDNILFMGTFKQSLTADVFKNIDLLVIPSRWHENSPLVLLNSLATHTPILIADVEGMTEFLTEGKNGYSFKRADINDLTEKLIFIIKTPGLLSKLSLTTEYLRTTEVMAKETLSFYQSI